MEDIMDTRNRLILIFISFGCKLVCGIMASQYIQTLTFPEKNECFDESKNKMLEEIPAKSVSNCGMKCNFNPECRRFRFDVELRLCTLYSSGENCITLAERVAHSVCYRQKYYCDSTSCSRCPVGYYGNTCENIAKDCKDWKAQGYTLIKGLAYIRPNGVDIIEVECNFKWDIVIMHNRVQECLDQDFNRTWNDYSLGFGKTSGNHWLGLKNVHDILNQSPPVNYELHVKLKTASSSHQCFYLTFNVGNEASNFALTIGNYVADTVNPSQTLGDALLKLPYSINGQPFSAFDRDYSNGCPVNRNGWWYLNSPDCSLANINGLKVDLAWLNAAGATTNYVEAQLRLKKV